MKASNLNLPKPSIPPLHITSPENAVAAAEGKFTARLRGIGQTWGTLACRLFPTGRDILSNIKNSVLAVMMNALSAIGNYFSGVFDKTLFRSSLQPPAEPSLFILDKTARYMAEKIIDDLLIPLESEWERKNGMSGSLEKLIHRIDITLTRLAAGSRDGGSESHAKREAKYLKSHKIPGLAMLIYLYENRVGEGIFESLLLSQAGDFGERYERNTQNPQHPHAIQALESLWSMIIALRLPTA